MENGLFAVYSVNAMEPKKKSKKLLILIFVE